MMSQLSQQVKQGVIVWLLRKLPTCQETTQLVSDSLDQKLPLRQLLEMKLHLFICIWCERYQRQLLFIRNALRHSLVRVDEQEFPPATSLSPEARERLKRALSSQDQ